MFGAALARMEALAAQWLIDAEGQDYQGRLEEECGLEIKALLSSLSSKVG